MRFIIMHMTSPHWEAGANPGPKLIARVGELIGEMSRAGTLLGAEGLRASSKGVRVHFVAGERTVVPGPFTGDNELAAGFAIVRVPKLEDAIAWASRIAEVKGDIEVDIRPVTEPWDIGLGDKPANLTTRRYMLLEKADATTEAGLARTPKQCAALQRVLDDARQAGVLVTNEALAPSSRGRRYKFSDGKHSVTDGPFAESKELIAGYVLVQAASLDEAADWVPRYGEAVRCSTVELREVLDD
jgi:hypothetical protein